MNYNSTPNRFVFFQYVQELIQSYGYTGYKYMSVRKLVPIYKTDQHKYVPHMYVSAAEDVCSTILFDTSAKYQ